MLSSKTSSNSKRFCCLESVFILFLYYVIDFSDWFISIFVFVSPDFNSFARNGRSLTTTPILVFVSICLNIKINNFLKNLSQIFLFIKFIFLVLATLLGLKFWSFSTLDSKKSTFAAFFLIWPESIEPFFSEFLQVYQ